MKRKKALFEKLKRKFEMNIGIYYTRPLKDKMVYKARNGIEIKGKFIDRSLFDFCPVGGVLYVYRVVANLLRVRRECERMCKFDKNGSKYIYKFWNFPKMCL